jgi:membrane-bound serine protease (ClpP class)
MSFIEIILSFLATPDVVFLFFSLGGLALVVELWSPGITGPGVVGIILLLLSFAGLGSLPFSWVGVVFLVFAIVMLIAEAHAPGFGIFGLGAAISLVLGGIMLAGFFGTPALDAPPEKVSLWLLFTVAGLTSVAAVWIGVEIRRARGAGLYVSPVSTGGLVGKIGVVSLALSPAGRITLAGESWAARLGEDAATAEIGANVIVRKVEGLTLEVEIDPESHPEHGGDSGG